MPTEAAQDVRALAIDRDGQIWAATREGVYWLPADRSGWQRVPARELSGPTYDITSDPAGSVWVAAWDGLYEIRERVGGRRVAGIAGSVKTVVWTRGGLVAGGPEGFYRIEGGRVFPWEPGCTRYLHRMAAEPGGTLWIATAMGLYQVRRGQGRYLLPEVDAQSIDTRGVAPGPRGEIWVASLGGVQVWRNDRLHRQFGVGEGLPSADTRCLAHAPDGSAWVGTTSGLARYDGQRWSVRQGRRWLLDNHVRDVVVEVGGAVWVATAGGVSRLAPTNLTLLAKAGHFDAALRARHIRPPGIVGSCRLQVPGDVASWEPEDDDNDGGYTALFLAAESYRYAATRDPAALASAREAFGTLEFLQQVTGTPGFVARTVVPANWTTMHDPNTRLSEKEWSEQRVKDPRDKYVPERWRPSADGRWLWKGDTSSDEITAHMFGYYVFHELAAEDDDRARVRAQVGRMVDHLLEHELVLVDLDGRPTRWGVWAPGRLNHDPDWAMERGVNSVEILSFLKLAHHLTGAAKYEAAYRRLIDEHHYDRNVLEAPNLNPAWRTYIDTELLAFAYPALLALERDSKLRRVYQRSFERWHNSIRSDGNPFFEFLYAAYARPRGAHFAGANAFLHDVPLDLIRWTMDNSLREDLRLVRSPILETIQTDRLLPPSEISYSRTDQNPRQAVQGAGGRSESDGVFYLLPYWMGRYYGWIAAPSQPAIRW